MKVRNLFRRQNTFADKPASNTELILKFQIGKKIVLRNFAEFTKEAPAVVTFSNKFASLFIKFFREASEPSSHPMYVSTLIIKR